jgi:hypothetical protein
MSMTLPPRQGCHTEHEHQAYQAGFESGWEHANYVEAYGWVADTEPNPIYRDHLPVWQSGYDEGVFQFVDQFEADEEPFDERL